MIISLMVIALTIAGVYLWRLGNHDVFFENSFLSTTVLSVTFCSFITVGLFQGSKSKSSGDIVTGPTKQANPADTSQPNPATDDEFNGMIAGVVTSMLLWILAAIVLAVSLWAFGKWLVIPLVVFAAMLYWIFFRALRLVSRHSKRTRGDLPMSVIFGVFYTFLYNFWIYGIFFLVGQFRGELAISL